MNIDRYAFFSGPTHDTGIKFTVKMRVAQIIDAEMMNIIFMLEPIKHAVQDSGKSRGRHRVSDY